MTTTRNRESKWESEAEWWATAPTNSAGGWEVPENDLAWWASDAKLVMMMYAMSRSWPNHSRLSVTNGIEVSVEVQSNVEGQVEDRATCRCLHTRVDLS
jgi:hypothetical protein